MSSQKNVRRGSIACFIGVVFLIFGAATGTNALAGTGMVLLFGGFALAVAGRLAG